MKILQNNLDDAQLEAAKVMDRNAMVLAGPGSGKTHMLVHRVGYLIRTSGGSHHRVLCLTFTVEAAKEMRRRLNELVRGDDIHRVVVMNFHQFSRDLLYSYGHLIGLDRDFGILGETDRSELIEEVISGLSLGKVNVRSVREFISTRKGRREYRGDLLRDLDSNSLQAIFAEYEKQREGRNQLDFDDLLLKAVKLLEQVEWVREMAQITFPHIEVDELQDTSLLQLTMVQLLYRPKHSLVFAVADDDQMVYEWRDARPETLNEFEQHFSTDVLYLRHNYRCPKNVITVANAVIANNLERRDKLVIPMRNEDGRVTLSLWDSREEQAKFISQEILQSVSSNGRSYKDHAVLVRARRSLEVIKEVFQEPGAGVPYIEVGGTEVQECPFVRLLLGSLRYVAGESYGAEAIRRSCRKANGLLEGEIFKPPIIRDTSRALAGEFNREFIASLCNQLGVIQILQDYGEETEVTKVERFLTMVALARSDSAWQDYAAMVKTILLEFDSLLDRANLQQDAVRLMTIHGAKGLQFPMVFTPDLCDAAFPNMRSRYVTPNMPEERRLFFVASTRSQEELHLSRALQGPWGYPADDSPFIDELLSDGECSRVLECVSREDSN